jgi:hypothetical protein
MVMPIKPEDIGGDPDASRRIIVLARSIAPCIDFFADGSEAKKDAIAILKGVLAEVMDRGARTVRSQAVGTARVTYEVGSAFTDDDRDSLRALCGSSSSRGDTPAGSFPKERPIGRVWPEAY